MSVGGSGPARTRLGMAYLWWVNPFFEELGARFAAAASRQGVGVAAPTLDPTVAAELLDLARVAAHTQERRFAPLASYLAGVFASRLEAAGGPSDPASVARLIREVREELEREAGSSAAPGEGGR
jgi:Domain of unknown function (DUF6457)